MKQAAPVALISLHYGKHFTRAGTNDKSIYRKLQGISFECAVPGEGRVHYIHSFDGVLPCPHPDGMDFKSV